MKNILFISLIIIATSCNNSQPKSIPTEEKIPITENQKIISTPINQYIESYGMVNVPPSSIYEIYSKSEGYISKMTLMEGQSIVKGQVLAEITSPLFAQWKKELATTKTTYEWQKKHYERNLKLYENQAISDKDFQEIEKEFLLSKTTYDGWKEQLNEIGFTEDYLLKNENIKLQVLSSVQGTIIKINTKNGEKITADSHLFTIIDKSQLLFEMKVLASNIENIKEKQPFFIVQSQDTIKGYIYLINDWVEDDNTVKVYGKFNNSKSIEKLIIGQHLFAQIKDI